MDLANVTVEIRPRRSWESIDLGFRLARANAFAVWVPWPIVFLPIATLICVGFWEEPWLGALAIWWFKPWFDRIPMHVLSRAVFGATPGVGETLRAIPSMFRKGALSAVLQMRFDAARSLNLALWQLEELPWGRWRRRVRLIEGSVRRPAGWLTVTCVWLELTCVVSIFALTYWMTPPSLLESFDAWLSSTTGEEVAQYLVIASWVLAVAVFEPFYVAAGFGLYLNRRTELEAWDIEIAFRRMANRHTTTRQAA